MKKIYDEFLENCNKNPDKIAVTYNEKKVTYYQLYEMAKKVAEFIKYEDIPEGSIIGIIGKKTEKSIAAILGILFANMTYLPIDSTYPTSRIQYIINNSGVKLLICIDTEKLNSLNNQIGISEILNRENSSLDIPNQFAGNFPCYVIYTSGSSANKPNGVVISHESILNTVEWRMNYYGFSSDDSILLFASLSFDSSVEDIFCALSTGAKLVVADDLQKIDPRYIATLITSFGITHMMLVPSMYSFFIQYIDKTALSRLKVVVLAGEDFTDELIKVHYKNCPNVKLYNEYGPTENAVCSTCAYIEKDSFVNIGTPISNVGFFLLNEGEINENFGELCLFGPGLASGYLNNNELTEKKFIKSNKYPYEMYYLTGDIVKKIDGKLVYQGRKDHLVKINGVRIDLNELTNVCRESFSDILEVYALGYTSQNSKIALFYTTKSKNCVDENKLREEIHLKLPQYMMPSYIRFLSEFPLLPNFKIDICALRELCE